MTDKYILQAREILADTFEAKDCADSGRLVRKGRCDDYPAMAALARVLEQHDKAQPTFEQRVEAIKRTVFYNRTAEEIVAQLDRHLAEIMAPKVDPLVEALRNTDWDMDTHQAELFRKALAARGLEIKEIAQ